MLKREKRNKKSELVVIDEQIYLKIIKSKRNHFPILVTVLRGLEKTYQKISIVTKLSLFLCQIVT